MGLDRDDTIIRRRLRQKLEFLVEDAASATAPSDAELQAWWDAHPESFRAEPQLAFRQVYVSPERRGPRGRGRRGGAARAAAARPAPKPRPTASATRRCCRPSSRSPPCAKSSVRSAATSRRLCWRSSRAAGPGPSSPRTASTSSSSASAWPPPSPRSRRSGRCSSASCSPSGAEGARRPLRAAAREVQRHDRDAEAGADGGRPSAGAGARRAVRRGLVLALAASLALAGARPGERHEARPGFLELRQTGPETWSFLWKKPTGGEVEIQIAPVIPEGCRLATQDRQQLTPGAMVVRGTLSCAGGLAGKTIAIAGLEATITDVLVRLHHADGRLESHLLRPATPSVDARRRHHGRRAGARLRAARHPAHPARRRPPAVRARA